MTLMDLVGTVTAAHNWGSGMSQRNLLIPLQSFLNSVPPQYPIDPQTGNLITWLNVLPGFYYQAPKASWPPAAEKYIDSETGWYIGADGYLRTNSNDIVGVYPLSHYGWPRPAPLPIPIAVIPPTLPPAIAPTPAPVIPTTTSVTSAYTTMPVSAPAQPTVSSADKQLMDKYLSDYSNRVITQDDQLKLESLLVKNGISLPARQLYNNEGIYLGEDNLLHIYTLPADAIISTDLVVSNPPGASAKVSSTTPAAKSTGTGVLVPLTLAAAGAAAYFLS